jgi:hypothetical protein
MSIPAGGLHRGSEFATPEEAAAYEEWLRAKVAASLADERPSIPHDGVMAEMRAIIERKGRPAGGRAASGEAHAVSGGGRREAALLHSRRGRPRALAASPWAAARRPS